MLKRKLLLFLYLALIVLAFLSACNTDVNDGTSENTGSSDLNTDATDESNGSNTDFDTDSSTSSSFDISTDSNLPDDNPDNEQKTGEYFVATIIQDANVVSSPYTGGASASDELFGLYYATRVPGGAPVNDGTGKIWLTLKPLMNTYITEIIIDGEYSSVQNVGMDLYCINDVGSSLTVSTRTAIMKSTQSSMLKDYGYGISENGELTVTWQQDHTVPIRYVEIGYTNSTGTHTEYIDAEKGSQTLFNMTENKIYNVSIRAVGEKALGRSLSIECCYMTSPKDVSFPRIEITTQDLVWPKCDFVQSPDGCWGAGITNALYEQCVMTLYNKDNEVVYISSQGQSNEYNGAKLKIRGNTSARYASSGRYPYKLKLDQKYDLLKPLIGRSGDKEYEDKDWLLLNYGNDGYRIAGDAIADAVGTEWSPDYCYVALYLNGEYRGLYVLSEAVEEGGGTGDEQWRVNVDNDGFVFECDAYWWNEDLTFSTPLTEKTPMHFTFKYPDPDNINESSAEYQYLRDYLIRFEEALMKNDDSYLEYIDLDSFVKWLLVSDYLCINDGGGCNLFLYKKDSTDETKICMGPNWDFDSYMGSVDGLATIRLKWDGGPFYYQYLIEKPSFQKRYKELFEQTYNNLLPYINEAFAHIDVEAHSKLLSYDYARFGTSTKSLLTRRDTFISWLDAHLAWMQTQFK